MDLIKCPFVILVSVCEHTHPPTPPSHTPEAIKDHINLMINNASEHLDYITLWKIISSNLIRAHFGVDILSEIHAALNIWISYDIYGHITALCMTKEQAIKLYETKYLQIDLTFKPVQSDLDIAQTKGLRLALSTIDSSLSWIDHLKFLKLVVYIINESSEEVQLILNEISLIDEAGIEVNPEIWCIVGETTNNAELAQVDINREGKELSLMNAIDKARKHDTRKYKTCEIQDNMGL
ncbi:hypothetical protein F8M41_001565 [Gigaspora margarita]|uniref:Uncharacterized protein n=1 Tax=Gigaspora margarita TaxID=4874 RepID=A0A8H3XEX9_GIGMA|nr:hypothetical protein F8M41_001565 [Gigaspora margarita]